MNMSTNQLCFVLENKGNCSDSELISKCNSISFDNNSIKLEIYKLQSVYLMIIQALKQDSNTIRQFQQLLKSFQELDSIIKISNKLNCIFKKEALDNTTSDHKRIVMSLELKNDPILISEYKQIHRKDKIWPQIITNMDTIGILDMGLYLYNYSAFIIMDTHLDFDLEKDGKQWSNLPKEREWQSYVAKFQKVNPDSKAIEKWQIMTPLM